ncbi:MAG TPA: hypothetical protein VGY13_05825 [Solirubrobacteraceae bacterium]|jgi:hypothetical protein|nr:hypothetical protein [Solirubrobacteraceae bacterium]
MSVLRVHTPEEARALLEIERAHEAFTSAKIRLEMARWNYQHIHHQRERARQRGHLRLIRSPVPEQSGA